MSSTTIHTNSVMIPNYPVHFSRIMLWRSKCNRTNFRSVITSNVPPLNICKLKNLEELEIGTNLLGVQAFVVSGFQQILILK